MSYVLRLSIAAIVGLAAVSGQASAQSATAMRVPGGQQMPLDPGVPIGCLLSPSCGPKLFTHPDGRIVTPQAPIDPEKGMPCLLNPKCGNTLSIGPRDVLFQRAMSPDDVITSGAKVGDYIPVESAPLLVQPAPPDRQRASKACTASVLGTKEAARNAQRPPNEGTSRRDALEVVVGAYKTAVAACQPVQQ
jgi:hypothetical protein